jgi:hypothetical protein
MRRCFIIFLMLLMPFRVWAFAVMNGVSLPAHSSVDQVRKVIAELPSMPDCHGGMAMMDGSTAADNFSVNASEDAANAPSPSGCHCQTCQLCVPLVAWTLQPMVLPDPVMLGRIERRFTDAAFSSASTANLLRPPSH